MAQFWFAGGYYVDLDEFGQFRIAGPGNHLFCGLTLPKPFYVSHVRARHNVLKVRISFDTKSIFLHMPVMGDIRSVRSVTEVIGKPRPTFKEIQELYPQSFSPNDTSFVNSTVPYLKFARKYGNVSYGFSIKLPKGATLEAKEQEYEISSNQLLSFSIECSFTFPLHKLPVTRIVANSLISSYLPRLPGELQQLVQRSEDEIEHLIMYSKTSSFEYGTVFPRDWTESAELGKGDLTQRTIDEMYGQALSFVSHNGEGWHENVIGELAYQFELSGKEIIDRGMVDIEPRYLLGLGTFSSRFLAKHDNLNRLKSVAHYVLDQARENDHIVFKQRPVGNWRDSPGAFQFAPNPIAPFDVNAVFYPRALSYIYDHRYLLSISDDEIIPVLEKWKNKKDEYRFERNGMTGYGLCLYGDSKILQVHHSDEAYLYLLGNPSKEYCVSFAKRLLDSKYFYTASGPLIVSSGQGFNQAQYHGEVIWPKQSALCVAGLRRQIEFARQQNWEIEIQEIMRDALICVARSSLKAFVTLKGVPELYIDIDGKAVTYDSQHVREGQVSYIQLWSAVGFRRMLRELIYVSNLYDIPVRYYEE